MITVISGATKGIGRALAERFVREGSHLALCSRNTKELLETRTALQAINPEACILTVEADLSKKADAHRFGEEILRTFKRVDVLINNAGRFLPGQFFDEADGLLETLIEANLYSAYHLTRSLLPTMMKQGAGLIVNMSSIAALQAYPNGGSYSISKFALQGFSKNLRHELMPHGIKVTTICPGATWTDSWSESGIASNRIMKAEDIAEVVWGLTQLSPQAVAEEIVLRPQKGDL